MRQVPLDNKGLPLLRDYKHIFGKPGEGAHKYRIFGLAAVDLIASIVFAVFISEYYKVKLPTAILGTILAGIIAHLAFGVNTAFNRFLFE